LGVNGLALALPNALTGVLSIPLLYHLVRRPFGAVAGLAAALVLAVMPVTIATERNNTMDGLMTFTVLLAAWGFASAAGSGRLRPLLMGAVALGLAFNIKELEAFMPLPAFYGVYLLGAPIPRRTRLAHLGLASLVLLVISLAWPLAVDLTPPAQRPYVGSSTDNSEFGLIFGWNGISRLLHDASLENPSGAPVLEPGPNGNPVVEGPSLGNDVPPGPLRLFSEPLVEEASWLLPLALLGLGLVPLAIYLRRREGVERRPVLLALGLWGTWLLLEGIYFSYTTGLFHPYYLIMLGPPLAALVGAAVWAVGQIEQARRWLGFGLAALAVAVTGLLQLSILKDYPEYAGLAALVMGTGLGGLALLGFGRQGWRGKAAAGLLCAGLLAAPLAWAVQVTLNPQVDQTGLPSASQYTSQTGQGLAGGFGGPPGLPLPGAALPGGVGPLPEGSALPGGPPPQVGSDVIAYLEANTPPGSYLVATVSAQEAAPLVLATGLPVLTFGGFTGSDPVVDATRLAQMVADGRLRFVLVTSGPDRPRPDVSDWIKQNCQASAVAAGLYDCK
jgi:4-amino-4-deoxy-L-arabinose transferase-like glycosyltransferase